MKTLSTLFALSVLILLSGCASMDGKSSSLTRPSSSAVGYDEAYMARVERYARIRGIDLTWIHPPDKRPEQVTQK